MDKKGEWYAVQVRIGDEDRVVEDTRHLFRADRGEEIFTMKRKKELHGQGNWYTVPQLLVRGYVFFRTSDIEFVCRALAPFGRAKRILSSGSRIVPLHPGERALYEELGGDSHMIDISIGYKDADDIHILSGPLQGRRELVTKVARHQRSARISTGSAGETNGMWVGLRILNSKAEAEEMIREDRIDFSPLSEIPDVLRDKIA